EPRSDDGGPIAAIGAPADGEPGACRAHPARGVDDRPAGSAAGRGRGGTAEGTRGRSCGLGSGRSSTRGRRRRMKDDKGHHDASVEGGVTTDEAALSTVETLMAERRKYETWLETLEARRQSTPERVFTRVHGDYHDRLDAVIQQLKEHTEGLRAELASLTSRLSSLDTEQQQRRD